MTSTETTPAAVTSAELDAKLQALLDHVVLTLLEHARESGKALHEADMITLALVNLANTVRASARHIVEGIDLERRLARLQYQHHDAATAKRRQTAAEVGGFGLNMLAELINSAAQSGHQIPPEILQMMEKASALFAVPSSMPSSFPDGDVQPAPATLACANGDHDKCDGIVRSQLGPISGMDPCQCSCHARCDHLYDPDSADGPCLLCQAPRDTPAKGGDAPAPDGSQAP